MLSVTLWLGILTALAAIVTLRRVVSWRFMVRRAVWFDVAVTGFALWAFSGQGVTGTLTGVFTGLCFSFALHFAHWFMIADRYARGAIVAVSRAPEASFEAIKAKVQVQRRNHGNPGPSLVIIEQAGAGGRRRTGWRLKWTPLTAIGASLLVLVAWNVVSEQGRQMALDRHGLTGQLRCVNAEAVGRGAGCLLDWKSQYTLEKGLYR